MSFYLLRVSSETPVLKSNGAEFSELPEGNSNASIESVAVSSTVEGDKFRWTCLHIVLALIWSPLVMLLTFALDIWSFFDAFGVPSLPLLNVESYSDMRVVLLPALQSLYSAAITTYIFLEGNNPRSGIFTTRFLYMRAVFFACLSMLHGLLKLLTLSRASGRHVWTTFFLLVRGRLLCPEDSSATLKQFFAALLAWLLSFPAVAQSRISHMCARRADDSVVGRGAGKVAAGTPKDPDYGYYSF